MMLSYQLQVSSSHHTNDLGITVDALAGIDAHAAVSPKVLPAHLSDSVAFGIAFSIAGATVLMIQSSHCFGFPIATANSPTTLGEDTASAHRRDGQYAGLKAFATLTAPTHTHARPLGDTFDMESQASFGIRSLFPERVWSISIIDCLSDTLSFRTWESRVTAVIFIVLSQRASVLVMSLISSDARS